MPKTDDEMLGKRGRDQSDLELDPQEAEPDVGPSVGDLHIDKAMLFEQAVEQTRMALCVTDPHQPDNPIVYVNQAFTEITGYSREEALGRNCKFLQGPDTDPKAIEHVCQTLAEQKVRVIEILNYRRDGTSFVNSLHIGPVYDEAGKLTHFYGSQWDVTELIDTRARETVQHHVTEELQHRTKNLFGVFGALVRLTAKEAADKEELLEALSARLDAMGRAHETALVSGRDNIQSSDLFDLLETTLRPYKTTSPGRIDLDGPTVALETSNIVPLGLAFHELATNALKHGSLSRAEGSVHVSWTVEDGDLLLTWEEHGGPTLQEGIEPEMTKGMGSRLVPAMLSSAGGEIEMCPRPEGMMARIHLPLPS